MKKVVLITGGSEGLGYAIASALIKSNYGEVIILANNEAKLKQAATTLGCAYMVCDVTNHTDIERVVSLLTSEYGRLDVLINNAGVITEGSLDATDWQTIEKVVNVNTLGTVYFSKAVIPIMKQQKQGIILNIDSLAGLTSGPERTVYNASKWAVSGFSDSLRPELAPFGIVVMTLYPALINTNLFKNAGLPVNMQTALDVKDVAETVKFMLSFDKVGFDKVVMRNPSRV